MIRRAHPIVLTALVISFFLPAPARGGQVLCDGLEPTIVGTSGNDQLVGTNENDVIAGLGGDDSIRGRRGDDVICGGLGNDQTLAGEVGNDRLFGGSGIDALDPGEGTDHLAGGTGDVNFFVWSSDDDTYDGSGGRNDVLDHFGAPNGIDVDLPGGTISGLGNDHVAGIEEIWGTQFDDIMIGDDEFNHFAGRDGNDTLSAGGGGVLSGNGPGWNMFAKSNILVGEGGDDTLIGGTGYDAVSFFDAPAALTIDLSAGTSEGEGSDTLSGIEGIITSRNGDTVFGDERNNAFAISGRAESVDGRGGDDLLVALYAFAQGNLVGVEIDLAAGTLDAAESGMTSFVSIENAWGTPTRADVIRGDSGPNKLRGLGGSDKIYGRDGDDFLNGGRGRRDLLSGGAGTDRCVNGERLRGCEGS